MKIKLLLFSCTTLLITVIRGQNFEWANGFHGNDTQQAPGVTSDADGNVYTAVNFYNALDADPGAGTVNFTAAGNNDIAIVKTGPDGAYIWGKHIGSVNFETVRKVICDADNNVYFIGYFNGTLDFDPSASTHNLVSAGGQDAYIAKYDENGNYVWAQNLGSSGYEESYGIAIDADNNVLLVGYFQNSVDFDASATIFNMTAIGGNANFFLKLSSTGAFIWAKQIAYTFLNDFIIGADGNLYMTGGFGGTVDFNPDAGTANLTATGFGVDIFLAKYTADGVYTWAKALSGPGDELGQTICYDMENNVIYAGGYFSNTVDFNPAAGIASKTAVGLSDAYIIKFTGDGAYTWVNTTGGPVNDFIEGIAIDGSGDLHIGGNFSGTIDLDPGVSAHSVTSAGSEDIYFSTWDSDGNFIETKTIGGTGQDDMLTFYIGADGAILISGLYENIVDFDAGADVHSLSTGFTGWDGFTTKYCNSYSVHHDVTLCAGDSVFAGGAWQYTAGDYVDHFTPVEGCDSTITTHVVIVNPVLELGSNMDACSGDNIILDAENAGADFLWNTGAMTQTIMVSATGNYAVTVTYPGGCFISDDITITFHTNPTVDLGAGIELCAGESVVLDAENAGADFLWNTEATTQTIIVNATGNYSVTVTNAYGCEASDVVHVNVNALPVVELGTDQDICAGETVTLDAENPGSGYLWSTEEITQTITAGATGNYSVTVTNTFGCENTDAVHVEVHALPVVDLGTDIQLCSGEIAELNAENASSEFLWSTEETTQIISVSATGNYFVTVTNGFGCEATDLVHVDVNPLPDVDLGPDIILCAGEETTLNAGIAGFDYLWNTEAVTQTISIDTGGNYSVLVTDILTGCFSSDSIVVIDAPLPVVSILPLNGDTLCADADAITLSGIPAGGIFSGDGISGNTFDPALAGLGFHSITYAFTDVNGCSNTANVTIYVEVCQALSLIPEADITLYPNPASAYFIVASDLPALTIVLYKVDGTVVFSHGAMEQQTIFDISGLSAGIYFIHLQTANAMQIRRLVIVK